MCSEQGQGLEMLNVSTKDIEQQCKSGHIDSTTKCMDLDDQKPASKLTRLLGFIIGFSFGCLFFGCFFYNSAYIGLYAHGISSNNTSTLGGTSAASNLTTLTAGAIKKVTKIEGKDYRAFKAEVDRTR